WDRERDDPPGVESSRESVERLEPEAHGIFGEVLHGPPQLRVHRTDFVADVERREATAVERVQAPMLLGLLAALPLDRQHATPAAMLVFRRAADCDVA